MQPISEVMTRDPAVIAPDADVQKAAQIMRDMNIGAVPVCDGKRLLGMITDRDIAIRATARGLAPNTAHVADVMSQDISWAFDDQTVGEVLQQMGDQQMRRIPVVSRDNMELQGVVSLGDLAVRQPGPTHKSLDEISRAAPPQPKVTGKHPDWEG
jgi:CBS domain-containing protein